MFWELTSQNVEIICTNRMSLSCLVLLHMKMQTRAHSGTAARGNNETAERQNSGQLEGQIVHLIGSS